MEINKNQKTTQENKPNQIITEVMAKSHPGLTVEIQKKTKEMEKEGYELVTLDTGDYKTGNFIKKHAILVYKRQK